MAKKFTKEIIEQNIADLKAKNGKFKRSQISFDWMDTYIAFFCTDEQAVLWAHECAMIPEKQIKMQNDITISRKNVVVVREKFLQTFFYELSDKAIKEEKERRAAEREAERQKKELSPEEQILAKIRKIREAAQKN